MKKPYAKPVIVKSGEKSEEIPTEINNITKTYSSEEKGIDRIIHIAAEIVSSYVSNNPLPAAELPGLISKIYTSIKAISAGDPDARFDEIRAAVPIRKSVTPDFIICLEDGKRFKSLKRHIGAAYGLTPDQYRRKWNLPSNYPMVAPNYSATRSKLAKSMGLGQKLK